MKNTIVNNISELKFKIIKQSNTSTFINYGKTTKHTSYVIISKKISPRSFTNVTLFSVYRLTNYNIKYGGAIQRITILQIKNNK